MDLTYRTKVLQQWYMQLIKSCEFYKKVSQSPKLASFTVPYISMGIGIVKNLKIGGFSG